MSRELKLLTALCESLGFEIEEIEEQKIPSGQIIVTQGYNLKTKKYKSVELPVHGDEWSSIVGFILSHKDDIENGINDYGDLMPVLEFFNRNS